MELKTDPASVSQKFDILLALDRRDKLVSFLEDQRGKVLQWDITKTYLSALYEQLLSKPQPTLFEHTILCLVYLAMESHMKQKFTIVYA